MFFRPFRGALGWVGLGKGLVVALYTNEPSCKAQGPGVPRAGPAPLNGEDVVLL